MRLRIIVLFAFFPLSCHALFSQELLIVCPDTLETELEEYAALRRQSGLHVRLSPLVSSRPTGSHDILQLIRRANDTLAIDYVLLAGPPAALPPFRNELGSQSDYPYTLPDRLGPRLAVGRLPAMNRRHIRQYGRQLSKGKHGTDVLILPSARDWSRAAEYQRSLSERGISAAILDEAPVEGSNCSLFIYIGQGSSRAWLDAGINTETAASLFRISPGVILSIACSTASVIESESLAMKLLFGGHGTLNLIGCTGNCLQDESARLGTFIVAQWEAGRSVGEMLKAAERNYLQSGAGDEKTRHTLGEFILWGDPSLVPVTENGNHGQRE